MRDRLRCLDGWLKSLRRVGCLNSDASFGLFQERDVFLDVGGEGEAFFFEGGDDGVSCGGELL